LTTKQPSDRMARKRAQREESILQAAQGLFFSKGIIGTTTDEIAKKADISKGAVYLHFKTKDEIYFAIANKGLAIMLAMFKEAADAPASGLDKFRAIGYSFYDFTKKYPEYSTLIYALDAPRPMQDSALEDEYRSLNVQIGAVMVATIQQGVSDGSVRPDVEPVVAAWIISTSMQGFLRVLLVEKEMMARLELDEDHLVDYSIDLYGRSLMNTAANHCKEGQPKVAKAKKK
jgi:TetR/AcrR family transcriptional regulator